MRPLKKIIENKGYKAHIKLGPLKKINKKNVWCHKEAFLWKYQSQVSILGPVGYGPTTLPLRHSDFVASLT